VLDEILGGQYASRWRLFSQPKQFRILNWNIERGQRLSGVMRFILREQPDICVLQEVDLNARRTRRMNVADVLASQFRFNYVFGIEFEELSQGSPSDPAFHGQALLARCQMSAPRVLRFRKQSHIWHPRPLLPKWPIFQPRIGGRMALVAELELARTPLVIYNLHLESHGDDNLRLSQLSEVIQDSCRYPSGRPIIIAGDLNTKTSPSPLKAYLRTWGFQDACETAGCAATNQSGMTLDWIFVRGPARFSNSRVHQETSASDHYPVSTVLSLG
jgi:endonuclease/exonuclease/phosphatase family metal-dependent hydrolase